MFGRVGYFCLAVAILAGAAAVLMVLGTRRKRQDEKRIREWARQMGYAVVNVRNGMYHTEEGFSEPNLIPFRPTFYRVSIQDEQGGRTALRIRIYDSQTPLEVEWE